MGKIGEKGGKEARGKEMERQGKEKAQTGQFEGKERINRVERGRKEEGKMIEGLKGLI